MQYLVGLLLVKVLSQWGWYFVSRNLCDAVQTILHMDFRLQSILLPAGQIWS
jgi:hypothetical protein